jgi:hypothetical protein
MLRSALNPLLVGFVFLPIGFGVLYVAAMLTWHALSGSWSPFMPTSY